MMVLLISIAIGVLIGVIAVNAMASQLKSVRRQSGAHSYLCLGSLYLTSSQDVFLYDRTTRTPRPKSSNKK